jgi:hypothetical protein
VVTTADNGAFELETACAGWATLVPLDGAAAAAGGTRVEVRLGQTMTGIRVAARRKQR